VGGVVGVEGREERRVGCGVIEAVVANGVLVVLGESGEGGGRGTEGRR
jgi:hypothetical protein